ncbi:hypothetical protein OIU85_007708 [Salix viminalis]|uniref:Tonoplast intrinsic protein n=1 Tax=Salix viminalis TaxID=40686 RepID=A0A9Q0P9D5_SALVM|nr:hypothetical protein OIU85_007708 [Salix viminalis]
MPRKNEFGAADDEATHPDSMRAALAEFVSTFVFVFAGECSVLALDKVYKETGGAELASGLVAVALAHALALFSAVASSTNISGGHVNPAVTFGSLVGGNWADDWIYWVGPFLGGGLAALIYEYIVIPTEPAPHHAHQHHQPLPPED